MEKKSGKVKAILFSILVMIVFFVVLTIGQYIVLFPEMMKAVAEEGMTNTTDMLTLLTEKEGLMANAQFVGEIVVIAVMAIWYYFGIVKKEKLEGTYEPVSKKFENKYNLLFVAILILTGSFALFTTYTLVNLAIPEVVEEFTQVMGGLTDNALGLIAIIVGAPLSEEMAVRGIIMKRTKKSYGLIGCMIISGICFGIMHANIVQGIYAIPLGMVYGYIAYKFNSIIPTIIGHAFHNGLGGYILEVVGGPGAVIGLVLCLIALYFVSKKVDIPESKTEEVLSSVEENREATEDMFVEE